MAKVVVLTALAYFTGVGPKGTILHTDPDGVDPRARQPVVSEEEAEFLVDEKKVAKRTNKRVTIEGDLIDDTVAASERLAETADIDNDASDRPSGLDSRQSVNHPKSHGVHGGSTTPPASQVVSTEPGATGGETGQDGGTSDGSTGDGAASNGEGQTGDGGSGLDPNDPDAPPVGGASAAKPAAAKGTVPKLSKPANKPARAKAPAGN